MLNRSYRFSLHGAVVFAFILVLLLTPASAESTKEASFATAMDGEAKIWTPATLTLQKGDKVKLTLHNALAKEHGFAIDELHINEVLDPDETKEVMIEVTEAGTFRFYCPLHEKHVGGQVVVE